MKTRYCSCTSSSKLAPGLSVLRRAISGAFAAQLLRTARLGDLPLSATPASAGRPGLLSCCIEVLLGGGVLELVVDQRVALRAELALGDDPELLDAQLLRPRGQDRLDEVEHLVGVDRRAVHLRDDAADREELAGGGALRGRGRCRRAVGRCDAVRPRRRAWRRDVLLHRFAQPFDRLRSCRLRAVDIGAAAAVARRSLTGTRSRRDVVVERARLIGARERIGGHRLLRPRAGGELRRELLPRRGRAAGQRQQDRDDAGADADADQNAPARWDDHERAPDGNAKISRRARPHKRVSRDHQRQREAIVPLAADGLDRRRRHARLRREHCVEPANALHAGVAAGGIEHVAAAHDVVRDDQRPGARQTQRPHEVIGITRLVGVDEDQVERTRRLRLEQRQRVDRASDADVDAIGKSRAREVRPRDVRVHRIRLQRGQRAARRQCPGQPDGAVPAERADLENVSCAVTAREQRKKLPFVRRDLVLRQPSSAACFERGVERGHPAERRDRSGNGPPPSISPRRSYEPRWKSHTRKIAPMRLPEQARWPTGSSASAAPSPRRPARWRCTARRRGAGTARRSPW